jgi:glycosyl transferase family 4
MPDPGFLPVMRLRFQVESRSQLTVDLMSGATEQPRALLIAYHFPPFGFSSGMQRTLKNVQYLPDFGWSPMVLTTHPRAYPSVRSDQLREIPFDVVVERAFCLDSGRDLAFRGRYIRSLAIPDRWISWWFSGVWKGLRLMRRYRPAVIWSTYPIATAHLIALTLHRLTKIPWVADVRDSMTEENYPRDPAQYRVVRWLEERVVRESEFTVFTTPGAVRIHRERYADVPADRFRVIENAYDEENFLRASKQVQTEKKPYLTLLHSGVLYPGERDTRPFFAALGELKQRGLVSGEQIRVVLRATGHDEYQAKQIAHYGLDDIVELAPEIGYEAALAEMQSVDGLLIFQAADCNHLIPAKLYEYLRACRPILALTDEHGDTAALLRKVGAGVVTPLDDQPRIARDLLEFISSIRESRARLPSVPDIQRFSRRERARELAGLFDEVVRGVSAASRPA